MLGICNAPIPEVKFVIRKDLKTASCEVSLLGGVVDEAEPRVVNKFEGFESVCG